MFQVFLHNSMATPSPPAYGERLLAALESVQAQDLEDGDWFRLRDGVEIHVLTEAGDDISLIEYPRMSVTVAEAIFEILRHTDSLIFLPGAYACRVAGSNAEPTPDFALAFEAVGLGEFDSAETLHDFLAEADALAPEAQTAADSPSRPPQRSLGGRISDFLFGREG